LCLNLDDKLFLNEKLGDHIRIVLSLLQVIRESVGNADVLLDEYIGLIVLLFDFEKMSIDQHQEL
jgi:hypothetical protein